ncbi:MAG: septum formation initiator family protein [Bacteroidetes bacterium]|nr:septum formation initiator family protein [Bacteroidota bacterium]MDA1334382.1 septum formation initiator family protein [Bacteroidota bacterium]
MSIAERVSDLASRFRKILFVVGASFVLIWVLFFDSHSIFARLQLSAEKSELEADNEVMRARIARLEEQLSRPLTAQEIEEIAREEYGMSRDGETVYPIKEK